MNNKSKVPLILASTMLGCIVATALTALIYHKTGFVLLFYLSAVFGAIGAQFIIMHIFAAAVFMIFKKKYRADSFWFRPKRFEKKLYKFLKVRQWKNHLKAWNDDAYSLDLNDGNDIIMTLCHAEVVHEVISVAGFLPILIAFYVPKVFLIFLLSSIVFGCVHLAFAVVQRYNRPRFIRIIEYRKNKDVGSK